MRQSEKKSDFSLTVISQRKERCVTIMIFPAGRSPDRASVELAKRFLQTKFYKKAEKYLISA